MMRGDTSPWGRRQVLKIAGGSAAGVTATSQLGVVGAQSSDASIRIDDQETDGDTVVVAEAQTEIESRLIIISDHQVDGTNIGYQRIGLDPGTSFTDRTVELAEPIGETQDIRAEIRTVDGNDELLARDGATVTVGEQPEAASELEFVEADPDAGFNYPYYLYTPARRGHEHELPLLVEPNNTPTPTDDFDEHRQQAERLITEQMPNELSDRLRVPALVPVFPRPLEEPVDWRHLTHQLDDQTLAITGTDLERIDLQLLQMVEHARERLTDRECPVTDDGILMNGFSASGNFADRFTMLHPDEVLSVTAGGVNGMTILPLKEVDGRELPYHVGIANVDELIGKSPNLDALDETRQFIYMGGDDENDTIPFDDSWTDDNLRQLALDIYGEDMIEDRFARSEELYEEAGIDAEFRVYEGVGHNPWPAADDITEFHLQTVKEYRSSFVFDVDWPAETVETGVEIPISVDVDNVVGVPQTAILALSVANDSESDPIETMDISIDDGSTKTIDFDYIFEESGEYVISVDGAYTENSLTVADTEPTENEDANDSPSDDTEQTDESDAVSNVEDQPGFGVMQTIAAIGGVGYLIKRRISNRD